MAAQTIREIEEEMEEIKMLMKLWNNFYRILTLAFEASKEELRAADPEFQQIKTTVAEHHDHFMKVIKKDKHVGQSIMATVKRTITLDGFNDLSGIERDKTMIDWHRANILLCETLGSQDCDKDRINRKRQIVIEDSFGTKLLRKLKSPAAKNLLIVVALAAIVGVCYLNWEAISTNPLYIDKVKPLVDSAAKMLGLGGGEGEA